MDPAIEQHFTDELKADPVVTEYYQKTDYKSVPDVLKGFAHAQKRLGSVVPLPNGDSKPEDIAAWRKEHLPKLVSAKLVDMPAQAPEKYEVKLPDGVPAEMWSDADSELATGLAKKHGWTQEALNDGLAVVASVLGKAGAKVVVDRQAAIAEITRWATEDEKVPVEQVDAALKRFHADPRSGWDDATKQAMADAGQADNPLVVKAIYKLMKDSGTFDTRNDGGSMDDQQTMDAKAATAEANAIIRDKANPKYALYHKGDKDTQTYVENLLKKGVPGTLEI
jgi:hypothetical protein